ncbi:DsrE/DsrF/DrsH-like family protein [Halostagnicola sp. A-GB9-2]|uniref:DsrE/DsrF/DrsH-like family protein n=1 Tax=Halostagnicola sp. A-GB9-2 TaxID=3048066 RepID=UPI0024C0DB32|nr:DsrE/DsrF/DrsH-like family protein [Halostagnicola sp. A-GB9-2]MDJ1434318.1 DsrE/DsrF/DrsH-like family protein [Halostagnicola sp. A-GB9-2]
MSTDNQSTTDADADPNSDPEAEFDAAEMQELRERVEDLEESMVDADTSDNQKKMTIVATQGSFDMAYPPLILGSTAAAFGWDVVIFHTFWGLDILHEEKSKNLKLSAVGNPNMPVPNAVAAIPGMDRMATRMMEKKIDENGTATIEELIELSLDQGVDLQACQMTIELMDYDEDDFYDGVTTGVGAATALQHMAESDIQLLV